VIGTTRVAATASWPSRHTVRADRDHLADHRLGRELSAGNDWLDVIDLDTPGPPEALLMRSMARIFARRCCFG